MKLNQGKLATWTCVIVFGTGCQTAPMQAPECPPCATAAAAIQPERKSTRAEVGAALAIHNHFHHEVSCRGPRPSDHGTGHLLRGDGFTFGRYGQDWYLVPHRGLLRKGWKDVIKLEHNPGPPRRSFPNICDLKQGFPILAGRPFTDAEKRELEALMDAAEPLEGFEHWRAEIGVIDHPGSAPICHEIRLQFYEFNEASVKDLNGNNFFMEIERCGHDWDGTDGIAQARLWHGGVYHGR